MTDILDRIDSVTAPVCAWCSDRLEPDGPSADFCGESHQQLWHRHGGIRRPHVDRSWVEIRITPIVVDTSAFREHMDAMAAAVRALGEATASAAATLRSSLAQLAPEAVHRLLPTPTVNDSRGGRQ